jgi:hypothetical protein
MIKIIEKINWITVVSIVIVFIIMNNDINLYKENYSDVVDPNDKTKETITVKKLVIQKANTSVDANGNLIGGDKNAWTIQQEDIITTPATTTTAAITTKGNLVFRRDATNAFALLNTPGSVQTFIIKP